MSAIWFPHVHDSGWGIGVWIWAMSLSGSGCGESGVMLSAGNDWVNCRSSSMVGIDVETCFI